MKGFKAFKKGMICDPTGNNPYQFAENTIFEQEEEAKICNSGFHFCKNPLNVLDYYPLIDENGDFSEFAKVEALDETMTDDNEKYCTKKIKIGAKLTLKEFIKASITVTHENIKKEVEEAVKTAKAAKKGVQSGGNSATLAGGNSAKLAGGYSATLAGGYSATLAGGNSAKLAGGDYAKLAGGENSIIVGDNGSKAKGKKGALIVLVDRKKENGKYIISAYKAAIVDGEIIKEDVFYELKNGELIEVKNNESEN